MQEYVLIRIDILSEGSYYGTRCCRFHCKDDRDRRVLELTSNVGGRFFTCRHVAVLLEWEVHKMRTFLSPIVVVACLGAVCYPVNADILGFEDVTSTTQYIQMPANYSGFTWTHFNVGHKDFMGPSGYQNCTVGNYSAFTYDQYTGNADRGTISSTTLFDFDGAFLMSAWRNSMQIKVDGYRGTDLLYSNAVIVNAQTTTWFDFDYLGIDRLELTSSGGTWAGVGYNTLHMIVDNFTFNETVVPVPVPGAMLLGVLGLGYSSVHLRYSRKL